MSAHLFSRPWLVAWPAGLVAMLATTACTPHDHERLNAPPQGNSDRVSEHQASFAYMGDNAMLAQMSLTENHFIPHQSALSGLGEARLARYAELLSDSGGVIHYQAAEPDSPLVGQRLASARTFLTECGGKRLSVEVGPADGRGMPSDWAKRSRSFGMEGYGERAQPPTRMQQVGVQNAPVAGSGQGGNP